MSPAREQREGRRVVELEVLEHHLLLAVVRDVDQRVVEDGQVAQAQEVHLDQPEALARRVVELGDDRAVLLALHHRDHRLQRLAGHDDAGRVHAPLPLEALDADGGVDDLLHVGVGVVERPELAALAVPLVGAVEDLLQRDVLAHHRGRHRLGDAVAHRERVAQDPRGVLDRLLGLDRAVGDDHRDPVVAVLVGDVADHLAAAALVEVDVEVGHRDPVGVEEPLEDEPVPQRVEVGDPHGVRRHRPGPRAAAGADADAVVLGPADEVRDDQEVAREAHRGDDADLEVGLRADRLRGDPLGVAVGQALLDLLDEPGVLGLALGHREARHVVGRLVELDVAALGDQQGVVARLGQAVALAPQLAHLGRRLDVVAVARRTEPLGVGHRAARGDAAAGARGRRRRRGWCSASRWWRPAGCRGPSTAGAGRRGPGSRWTGRGPSARGRSCRRPKMSWKSPAAARALS